MVIDDNPVVLETTTLLLENLGYQVRSVDGAVTALDAVETEHFDLVVTDITLQGDMNGVELAKALQRRLPNLPVILMTGYSKNLSAGAAEFIILLKPFGISDLRDAISSQFR